MASAVRHEIDDVVLCSDGSYLLATVLEKDKAASLSVELVLRDGEVRIEGWEVD